MNYSDYKAMIKKEYERRQKYIVTCYLFLILSIVFFAIFFFKDRQLPIAGAAFLLDLAAAVYALKAFKSIHPYWEMQLALKAKQELSEAAVCRFTAGVEYALEHKLSAFKGRALEIFEETLRAVQTSEAISQTGQKRLKEVLERAIPEVNKEN